MCDIYHVVGISDHMWSDSGIRVLAGSLAKPRTQALPKRRERAWYTLFAHARKYPRFLWGVV